MENPLSFLRLRRSCRSALNQWQPCFAYREREWSFDASGNKYIKVTRKPAACAINISRKYGTDEIVVRGRPGAQASDCITISNPSRYTTAVFAEVLAKNGIKVNGSVRLIKQDESNYQNSAKKITGTGFSTPL